jgi:hypothetical protein
MEESDDANEKDHAWYDSFSSLRHFDPSPPIAAVGL